VASVRQAGTSLGIGVGPMLSSFVCAVCGASGVRERAAAPLYLMAVLWSGIFVVFWLKVPMSETEYESYDRHPVHNTEARNQGESESSNARTVGIMPIQSISMEQAMAVKEEIDRTEEMEMGEDTEELANEKRKIREGIKNTLTANDTPSPQTVVVKQGGSSAKRKSGNRNSTVTHTRKCTPVKAASTAETSSAKSVDDSGSPDAKSPDAPDTPDPPSAVKFLWVAAIIMGVLRAFMVTTLEAVTALVI
jgi:hypothetical protein